MCDIVGKLNIKRLWRRRLCRAGRASSFDKVFLSPAPAQQSATLCQRWAALIYFGFYWVFSFLGGGRWELGATHIVVTVLICCFGEEGDQWESFILNNSAPQPSCRAILAKKKRKEFNFEPLWFLGQPPQLKCEVTCWQRVVSGVRRGRGGLGKYIWMNIDISLAPCGGYFCGGASVWDTCWRTFSASHWKPPSLPPPPPPFFSSYSLLAECATFPLFGRRRRRRIKANQRLF